MGAMISTRRWVIDTPVVETTGVLRTGLVWIRMHPSNSSGFPFWAGYPRLSVGSCFSVMKAILAHPSPLQIDTPYSLDPASEYRVCGLKFSSRSWRLPPTHFNTGLSDASMLAMRFFPMRLSHECEEYNHRIIMPKQEQASERPHRLRNGCVHAIIADMMIFDDLYYSFDMLQRRLHNLSGQDERKASEWFRERYGARLISMPELAWWNAACARTMDALYVFRNEYPRKAIDAVAMDYLNGTFPAFVSPSMSSTLIGLHASIDGSQALEPLADAVGYVNGHAVPNPTATDGYGQTITAAELMLSMMKKTRTRAFWRDDDGNAGKAVMSDAIGTHQGCMRCVHGAYGHGDNRMHRHHQHAGRMQGIRGRLA